MEQATRKDQGSRRHSTVQVTAQVLGIVAAPLLLAGLGPTHPRALTGATAAWWRDLHLLLLPIFPLLGVNLWWLLVGARGPLAWLGRVSGFLYITFYGALDVLAGVGTGVIRYRATQNRRPGAADAIPWLFAQGNALAEVGVWALLVGCLAVSALLLQAVGRIALPGAVLLCAAAALFLNSHIYFPVGVVAMLTMAVGFGLLQWARLHPRTGD